MKHKRLGEQFTLVCSIFMKPRICVHAVLISIMWLNSVPIDTQHLRLLDNCEYAYPIRILSLQIILDSSALNGIGMNSTAVPHHFISTDDPHNTNMWSILGWSYFSFRSFVSFILNRFIRRRLNASRLQSVVGGHRKWIYFQTFSLSCAQIYEWKYSLCDQVFLASQNHVIRISVLANGSWQKWTLCAIIALQ